MPSGMGCLDGSRSSCVVLLLLGILINSFQGLFFLGFKGAGGALVQKIITELLLRAGLWAVEIIVVNEVSVVFSLMELIVP